MYKAIIADDEEIFLRYLKTLIDFEAYGICLVGTAKNGREAVKLCEENYIDIAFVDITMPFMDGLEFSAIMKQKNPHLEIILITGHSEFEYARKALQLGVNDYILKPFEKEELVQVVELVTKKIGSRQQECFQKNKHHEIASKHYLANFIYGGYNGVQEEIDAILYATLGTEFQGARFISIAADFLNPTLEDWGNLDLWRYSIINILSEIFAGYGLKHLAFEGENDEIVCLVLTQRELSYIKLALQETAEHVTNILRLSITAGVSGFFEDLDKGQAYYEEAKQNADYKFIWADKVVITSDMVEKQSRGGYPIIEDRILLDSLKASDWERLQHYLERIFEDLQTNIPNKDVAFAVCVSLVNTCLNYISKIGFSVETVMGQDFSPFESLKQSTSLGDYFDYIKALYFQVMEHLKLKKLTRSSKLALAAQKFILQNYAHTNLSTQFLANQLYVDSSYLRAVFKKEFQDNITNFILLTRLHKAQELIRYSPSRLSDIAQSVGFSDSAYFSKCFKKQFGISPSEYYNLHH